MRAGRFGGRGGLRRGAPALAVLGLVSGAALAAAAGPAAAAAHPGAPRAFRGRLATAAGTISAIAGGVGGPGPATRVSVTACGVSTHDGSTYIADGPVVRKINARDWLTTPAGNGAQQGSRGAGGPAAKAVLGSTCGVTVDQSGNLVIAENDANQVAVVAAKTGTFYGQPMTKDHIYLVAGNGRTGYSQPGAVARRAPMSSTQDVAVDAHGNLVIAELRLRRGRNQVRVRGPGGGGPDGHVLRPADEGRGHLHGGRAQDRDRLLR